MEEFDKMTVPACVLKMWELEKELKKRKAEVIRPLQDLHDALRFAIIPDKMIEQDIKSITVDGVGRITVSPALGVSTLKDKKQELYDWLEAEGDGALMTNTLNSSTLKAYIRERMDNGLPIPDDCLKIKFTNQLSVTKA